MFLSFHEEDEKPCLFQNVITLCFPFIFQTQYFETDDQEFYKAKVCFILNNDVSDMDLVFAEEKYSKSGQLEKVRRHVGRELPPFIPDVIAQDRGAQKETILLVWQAFVLLRLSAQFT